MRLLSVQAAICLNLTSALLRGQMYLLSGTPQSNEFSTAYALDLLQVDGEGVKVVSEILPDRVATGQVHISYDWRKLVIVSALPNDYAVVLDFDAASVTKRCKLPKGPRAELVEQWLADAPGRGPSLELLRSGRRPATTVTAMSVNALVPCEESFTDAQPVRPRPHRGAWIGGVAGVVAGDGTYGEIDASGAMTRQLTRTPTLPSASRSQANFAVKPPNNRAYLVS